MLLPKHDNRRRFICSFFSMILFSLFALRYVPMFIWIAFKWKLHTNSFASINQFQRKPFSSGALKVCARSRCLPLSFAVSRSLPHPVLLYRLLHAYSRVRVLLLLFCIRIDSALLPRWLCVVFYVCTIFPFRRTGENGEEKVESTLTISADVELCESRKVGRFIARFGRGQLNDNREHGWRHRWK